MTPLLSAVRIFLVILLATRSDFHHVHAFAPPSSISAQRLVITVSVSPSPSTGINTMNTSANLRPTNSRLQTNLQAAAKPPVEAAVSSIAAVRPKMQLILVISSIIIIASYHINLIIKEKRSNEKTWRVYQADTREEWSRHVRSTEGWLYAVQTLRNAITAQTFLATTVLSLLTLITGKMWDIIRSQSTTGAERKLLTVQLVSIALTMLFSAYQFLQGVRLMTHAGFMFPVSQDTKTDAIMRKTQNCQWLGLRWLYISLAPIAWAIGGSRAFFVTSCCLLQFFKSIDRRPKGMGYEEFQGGGI